MSHLTLEALARLVDEAPDAAEARHLEACAACRAELAALREDASALAELPDLLPPPPGAWPALERRLEEEGLIRAEASGRRPGGAGLLRLAALLAVFLLGGASGFALRARLGVPGPGSTRATVAAAAPARTPEAAARTLREAEAAYLAALARYAELAAPQAGGDPVARLAALENIVRTTRDALSAAPADPVINGYHLTALAQREVAMRQIVLTSSDSWY